MISKSKKERPSISIGNDTDLEFMQANRERISGGPADFINMAIRALKMQKKLAAFRGMDICEWAEDYDYEENDVSEYEYETSVDNFLIDEAKEGGGDE